MPFSPVERHDVHRQPGRHLRRLGPRRRRHLQTPATSTRPARAAARCRSSRSSRTGSRGYNTDWNNIAPNVGVAWRPNVRERLAARAARRSRAGDDSRRLFGRLRPAGAGRVHRRLRRQPGQHAQPDARCQHRAGRARRDAGRCCCARRTGCTPRRSRRRRRFPIPIRPNRADNINAFHPDIEVASARTWTVGLQRALTKDMAVEIRYVGTRGVDQWSELNYNERNLIENGFQDEFMLAMANLHGQQRRRRRARGIVRLLRARHRHQPAADLPRLPQRQPRRRQSGRLHGGTNTWTNTALTAGSGADQSAARRTRRPISTAT